jgi:hypothetical protein
MDARAGLQRVSTPAGTSTVRRCSLFALP